MMLMCIILNIELNPEQHLDFFDDFVLFLVKFPCSVALHLFLFPEIEKGLAIMKLANN